jgi:hypothetical protein
MFNMLRLAVRTFVPKLQPPSKLTCKPGYQLFCVAILTPSEDKHGLSSLSQLGPFRASIRKLQASNLLWWFTNTLCYSITGVSLPLDIICLSF